MKRPLEGKKDMARRSALKAEEVPSGERTSKTSREEIQEKAVAMFLAKGYHATSTAELCMALGISKPTLYWYFKNKEEILYAIHHDHIERLLQPILQEIEGTADPMDRLRLFIQRYVKTVCSHPELKLLVDENNCLEPEHSRWVVEHWKKMYSVLKGAVTDLKRQGRAKDVNERFAVMSLIAMGTWPYNWFDYSKPEGADELADTIGELFFGGILTGA